MNRISEAWQSLRKIAWSGQGWQCRTLVDRGRVQVLAAVRHPEMLPALLIEVPAAAVPPVQLYPVCLGFSLFPEQLEAGPNGRIRLCLQLGDPADQSIFEALTLDVYEVISAATDDAQIVRGMLLRLAAWQSFMRRHGGAGLEAEAQIGLFAELLFLQFLAEMIPAYRAVDSWRGPMKSLHDFELRRLHLEVKGTTSSVRESEFRIGTLAQLITAFDTSLFVCLVSMSESPDQGMTLPELVGTIQSKLASSAPAASREFRQKLIHAGFSETHAPLYSGRRLQRRGIEFFEIKDGFPRILPSDLRPGVIHCSYSITASACMHFAVLEDRVRQLIAEAAHG